MAKGDVNLGDRTFSTWEGLNLAMRFKVIVVGLQQTDQHLNGKIGRIRAKAASDRSGTNYTTLPEGGLLTVRLDSGAIIHVGTKNLELVHFIPSPGSGDGSGADTGGGSGAATGGGSGAGTGDGSGAGTGGGSDAVTGGGSDAVTGGGSGTGTRSAGSGSGSGGIQQQTPPPQQPQPQQPQHQQPAAQPVSPSSSDAQMAGETANVSDAFEVFTAMDIHGHDQRDSLPVDQALRSLEVCKQHCIEHSLQCSGFTWPGCNIKIFNPGGQDYDLAQAQLVSSDEGYTVYLRKLQHH